MSFSINLFAYHLVYPFLSINATYFSATCFQTIIINNLFGKKNNNNNDNKLAASKEIHVKMVLFVYASSCFMFLNSALKEKHHCTQTKSSFLPVVEPILNYLSTSLFYEFLAVLIWSCTHDSTEWASEPVYARPGIFEKQN